MIKVTSKKGQVAVAKAYDAGQDHIFRFWDELDEDGRKKLLDQVVRIDFQLVRDLNEKFVLGKDKSRLFRTLKPAKVIREPVDERERERRLKAVEAGEKAIADGKVAVVTVAGGQATRLGYQGPKGAYPLAPVTGKSLFQIHAEKILALRKKYDAGIPWYIMTSRSNDSATREFFEAGKYFNLYKSTVSFFKQGMLPAVDHRGKLILCEKDTIFQNPDGHGGVITALHSSGVLAEMKKQGVEYIFYHQVDNPLVRIAEPAFVGYHANAGAQMSLKTIARNRPDEKMGIIGLIDGTMTIVEYSDLKPEELASKDENGNLVFRDGSPAIHIFSRDFIEKIIEDDLDLPLHRAVKKIPFVDKDGNRVEPEEPNGIKFESFVFDCLAYADKVIVLEGRREEEFQPVKSNEGVNTPDNARAAMTNLFGSWLEKAGVNVPRDEDGNVKGKIEISPLFAADADELKGKIDPKTTTFSESLLLQ